MSDQGSDKSEKPTPKRLADARKDGDVAKSQDLSKTALIACWLVMFSFSIDYLRQLIFVLFEAVMKHIADPNRVNMIELLYMAVFIFIKAVLPLLVAAAVIGTLVEFLQVGFILSAKKIKPDINHLNPAEGMKKIFSMNNLVELCKSVIKTVALLGLAWWIVTVNLNDYLGLIRAPLNTVWVVHWQAITYLLVSVIVFFSMVSVADFMYQKHSHTKKLMMSMHDIKQEHKSSEGDPNIKHKRKQLHQEWSEQNLKHSVRQSSAVVVNPTHYAVAIRYQSGETELPLVTAKGKGYMAALIRKTAEEEGIPIMRNVDLARSLYAEVDEQDYITPEFFNAVAEVLKWVESIQQKEIERV